MSKIRFTPLAIPWISSRSPDYKEEDRVIPKEWERIVYKTNKSKKKIICYGISIYAIQKDGQALLEKLKNNLTIFKECAGDVAVVIRPQALIKEWLPERSPELWKGYEDIMNEYKNSGLFIIDEVSRSEQIVSCSDAYYGDWCSIVWWFWQAKKPIMIENSSVN
jgi:hypothetical protein